MSQFSPTNYEVPRTTGVCTFTGRTLEPGEPYYATLVEIGPDSAATPDDGPGESTVPDAGDAPAASAGQPAEAGQDTANAASATNTEDSVNAAKDADTANTANAADAADAADAESLANALGMMRLDVSREAWEQGRRPARLFSYWKSTVPQPNERKKLFVDDAVLMNLFRRLEDATEPQRLAFRYVLGLILMRKRLLRFDGSERRTAEVDGETVEQEWWQLTPKLDVSKGPMSKWNEDETVELLDPRLDEAQIEQVTQQLGEILEAEL